MNPQLSYMSAQERGTGSLEAMFGIYALGLIPGLFLAGPLSDARGRRLPVLGAATASLVGSALLIAGARFPALVYALAYLGLTTPYLLTLAAPLAEPATLLLIATAAALASAAVVASASRPPADIAVGNSPPDASRDSSGALGQDRTGIPRPEQRRA